MNAQNILFKTNRFNLTQVREHFINPCCFGEDLAAWLREKLSERGIVILDVGQEDWGWYLQTKLEEDSYFLGVNGNPDQPSSDMGEWRVIVKKNQTIWQRLFGRGKINSHDRMIGLIEEVLLAQPDFASVRRED